MSDKKAKIIFHKNYYGEGVTPVGSTHRYYIAVGVRRRGKTAKHEKGRSEKKVVGFRSASLFPARKREVKP